MVKLAALALLASLTSVAEARQPPPPDEEIHEIREPVPVADDEPAFNLLGFRIGIGALPIEGERTTTIALGIGVEHPVFKKTRVFGEYEWLWLFRDDPRAVESMLPRPDRHGTGHRASLGLRRELAGKRAGRSLRLFSDVELGGGLALANENMTGVQLVPNVFVGLRAGYDLYSKSDDSPSRTWEAEVLLRAVAIRDGIGFMFGIGFAWGN